MAGPFDNTPLEITTQILKQAILPLSPSAYQNTINIRLVCQLWNTIICPLQREVCVTHSTTDIDVLHRMTLRNHPFITNSLPTEILHFKSRSISAWSPIISIVEENPSVHILTFRMHAARHFPARQFSGNNITILHLDFPVFLTTNDWWDLATEWPSLEELRIRYLGKYPSLSAEHHWTGTATSIFPRLRTLHLGTTTAPDAFSLELETLHSIVARPNSFPLLRELRLNTTLSPLTDLTVWRGILNRVHYLEIQSTTWSVLDFLDKDMNLVHLCIHVRHEVAPFPIFFPSLQTLTVIAYPISFEYSHNKERMRSIFQFIRDESFFPNLSSLVFKLLRHSHVSIRLLDDFGRILQRRNIACYSAKVRLPSK